MKLVVLYDELCLITCQSEKKHIEIKLYLILIVFYFHELYLCKQKETFS